MDPEQGLRTRRSYDRSSFIGDTGLDLVDFSKLGYYLNLIHMALTGLAVIGTIAVAIWYEFLYTRAYSLFIIAFLPVSFINVCPAALNAALYDRKVSGGRSLLTANNIIGIALGGLSFAGVIAAGITGEFLVFDSDAEGTNKCVRDEQQTGMHAFYHAAFIIFGIHAAMAIVTYFITMGSRKKQSEY